MKAEQVLKYTVYIRNEPFVANFVCSVCHAKNYEHRLSYVTRENDKGFLLGSVNLYTCIKYTV